MDYSSQKHSVSLCDFTKQLIDWNNTLLSHISSKLKFIVIMSRLSRTGLDAIPLTAISASDGSNTNSTHLRQAHSDSQHDNINIVGEISAALPPVDKGRQAWTFLAAAFVVEGLCWGKHVNNITWTYLTVLGMPQSYGLFQEYLTVHTDFGSSGVSMWVTTGLCFTLWNIIADDKPVLGRSPL